MDIFNRPHSIAEDTLHYTIYPPENQSDKTSATSLAACISAYLDRFISDFVWHRDAFEVKIILNPDDEKTWVLEGRMRVGDCVDDEWFSVWLLKQISQQWDIVISVYDSDGEFLLIEAADALPSWVKPANSENRVWIYSSHLHLIPLSHISPSSRRRRHRKLPGSVDSDDEDRIVEDEDTFLATEDALKLVRDTSIDTLAPPAVEKIVWQRVASYPDAAKLHIHVATGYVPVDIAKALVVDPSLVQKAVETFYTRDAIQLRAAHRMTRFSPNTSVLSSIEMTRTAYAQLMGQKFFPPKIFGSWKEPEGTKEWRWRDVGMKIAVGFEMLYQESKGRTNTQDISADQINSATEATKDTLRRNPDYQIYLGNLEAAGYFKGELKGSALWNSLENKAATTFVEVRRPDDATRKSFASQVDAAIANSKDLLNYATRKEDSDGWLNLDAKEFEEMLESTRAKPRKETSTDPNAMDVDGNDDPESLEDQLASQQAKQLKDLAAKVEDFIEGEGGLEGAIFEDEELSDEPFSDDEGSSESESEGESDSDESKQTKKQAALEKLVPALEPSDYGKMPASYHVNSQRVAAANLESDAGNSDTKDQSSPAKSNTKTRPTMRPPIIPRDKYDGVDSDDETDEDDVVEDEESEEDQPQVVGEIEIDMDEEEEEFLEFSRQALGITDAQWADIVKDRKDRGAFLPSSASKPSPFSQPPSEKTAPRTHTPRVPEPGPRPNVNPDLDSFETVMKALDEALQSKKSPQKASVPRSQTSKSSANKGKGKEKIRMPMVNEDDEEKDEDEDFDIEAAMQAELKEALEDMDGDGQEPMDYNMIKNFLESYKSQAGLSGPVSNLAGRLQPGFKLPRDDF